MDRADIVRKAYERFSNQDYEGALEFFDADAQVEDLLRPGEFMDGRDAVLEHWTKRFDEAHAEVLVFDAVEIDDDRVLAAVCFQAYDQSGQALRSSFVVASRVTFDGVRIVRVEHTSFNDIPDEVKALFHVMDRPADSETRREGPG